MIVATAAAASLLAMLVAVAVALPAEVRAQFSIAEDVTMGIFLLAALAVLYGIARTRVRTDDEGVHILNGYRHHDLTWAEVVSVGLGRGAPWAVLDTSHGTTLQLMAIQRADGERAVAAVRELRAQLDRRSPRDP
ncbi:MAG TPA: PH domain-containing protein [Nocardioidaceae bacterium]|jgi:hypothetical protein|nr:PH domain-containing protein [Nocardioidaceae bacterium]